MANGSAGAAGAGCAAVLKADTTSVTCRSYIFWEVKSQTTLDTSTHVGTDTKLR